MPSSVGPKQIAPMRDCLSLRRFEQRGAQVGEGTGRLARNGNLSRTTLPPSERRTT